MKSYKKVLLAVTAAMVFSAPALADKLRIGTEGAYPPFNMIDSSGEVTGFDIDIAKALCEEMKVECEFVTQDWDGIIPALLAGQFDAIIASMSITDERKEKVDFTNKYYNTGPAIAVANDSAITEATDAGLAGKALGAQSSTTHSNYAEAKFPSADLKLYPTPDEYKLDIASGRVDAVIDGGRRGKMRSRQRGSSGSFMERVEERWLGRREENGGF